MHLRMFSVVVLFLHVYDVYSLPPYEPYKIVFDDDKGMMTYKDQGLMIFCRYKSKNQRIRLTDAFPRSNDSLSFTGVYIGQCLPINTTYVDEFKALNINTSIIESLQHSFNQDSPLPPGNYTKDLTIKHLSIENARNKDILKNVPNFFDPLNELQFLYVSGIDIPPLPAAMRLINLTLSGGSAIKDWGNCQHLNHFSLSHFNDLNFPKWPSNCTRLEYLEIENLLPSTALLVAEKMIAAAPSLYSLKITYCKLQNLPFELIRAAEKLEYLDLSDNGLYDELLPAFPYNAALKTLDLSRNDFRGYGLGSLVPKLPVLRDLILRNGDEFYRVCTEGQDLRTDFIVPLQNSSVEYLDLTATDFYLNCFDNIRFSNVKRISISPPDPELKLLDLPQTDAGNLVMDFGYNDFLRIIFDEKDYETLRKENSSSPYSGRNLTILVRYVSWCDCEHGWLARALRDFPHIISIPNLRCIHEYGRPLLEEPIENLECNKTGRDYCFYRQSWRDGIVTAECEKKAWMKMEYMYPLHGLNVSGEQITSLHTNLPDDLKWLDLRNNLLSRANAEEATVLFAAGRRVWLTGNLWLCDCENRALLDAIQRHQEQVQDYDLLKCVGTGEALSSISTDVLCQVALISSLSVFGVLLLIAGVIVLLMRRYGEQLRMFLYSRGWCISCLQRQDVDDKPYDAFLSFAHEDQEYVMETLLPGLENAPEKFRICVHYRDWFVGDWIPAQIMRSVQLSKRTLILLSKNFVASAWSTLELRYSLANAVEEPNAKVLVLIKDDVLDMDLDVELRRYLTFNTYLRCDDPWFWEKIRYAMPHRVKNKQTLRSENIDIGMTSGLGLEIFQNNQNIAIDIDRTISSVQEDTNLPPIPTASNTEDTDIIVVKDEEVALEVPNVAIKMPSSKDSVVIDNDSTVSKNEIKTLQ